MWKFHKKLNLPAYISGDKWSHTFELTSEENSEVQHAFRMFKNHKVDPKYADEIKRCITAHGLYNHTNIQISRWAYISNKENIVMYIDKAITSISKAYSIFPIPIYVYDLACLQEMSDNKDKAKDTFNVFLKLQSKFIPSRLQQIEVESQSIDIEEAIMQARIRVASKN